VVSGEIAVRSPAFGHGSPIPKRFAFSPEGENISPPLQWTGVPQRAQELVVIVEDPIPQKPIFLHWIVYGIPASATGLPEGVPADQEKANGFTQGLNDFGHLGWGGPLPSPGEPPHKYQFWVYAVDMHVTLPPGATKKEVMDAIGPHILSNGRIIGTYKR